jgi:hypothetical protein
MDQMELKEEEDPEEGDDRGPFFLEDPPTLQEMEHVSRRY